MKPAAPPFTIMERFDRAISLAYGSDQRRRTHSGLLPDGEILSWPRVKSGGGY
jgi:hypothetical protein